ncbi:MAG TPA: pentapeptide repeat-containing protein [Methylophaga sp.]|nr:pentapeptide repeat-containing protein [Methylophaga sp.]
MKSVLLMMTLLVSTSVMAYDEIYLKRLLKENQCHHCTLNEAPLADHDLQGADMSESNLKGINLQNSQLQGAWFTHSEMHGANLEGAQLQGALMDYTHLVDANLRNANLDGAQMIFSDLSGADLTGASMEGTSVRGIVLCDTTMPDGSIDNSGC